MTRSVFTNQPSMAVLAWRQARPWATEPAGAAKDMTVSAGGAVLLLVGVVGLILVIAAVVVVVMLTVIVILLAALIEGVRRLIRHRRSMMVPSAPTKEEP